MVKLLKIVTLPLSGRTLRTRAVVGTVTNDLNRIAAFDCAPHNGSTTGPSDFAKCRKPLPPSLQATIW